MLPPFRNTDLLEQIYHKIPETIYELGLNEEYNQSGINKKKFGHVSLSGGALLNYIAGEKLPGLEALKS